MTYRINGALYGEKSAEVYSTYQMIEVRETVNRI